MVFELFDQDFKDPRKFDFEDETEHDHGNDMIDQDFYGAEVDWHEVEEEMEEAIASEEEKEIEEELEKDEKHLKEMEKKYDQEDNDVESHPVHIDDDDVEEHLHKVEQELEKDYKEQEGIKDDGIRFQTKKIKHDKVEDVDSNSNENSDG